MGGACSRRDCGRLREQIEGSSGYAGVCRDAPAGERDGQRPEDARTLENAGTASDRKGELTKQFSCEAFFLGLAAASGTGEMHGGITARVMRRRCFAAAEGVLAILLGIGVAGILRHRSAGQARAGENGKETAEAPESAAAENAVRIRLAESEKQSRRLLAGVGKTSRRNETMQSGRTAGSMQRSRRTGEELQLELDAVEMAKK